MCQRREGRKDAGGVGLYVSVIRPEGVFHNAGKW